MPVAGVTANTLYLTARQMLDTEPALYRVDEEWRMGGWISAGESEAWAVGPDS